MGRPIPNSDARDVVRHGLISNIQSFTTELLGQPNKAFSSAKEWRWGNKGSIAVVLCGPKAGLWRDHASDAGGDLFDLVGLVHGLTTFPERLEWATRWLGLEPGRERLPQRLAPAPSARPIAPVDDEDQEGRIRRALAVWHGSKDPVRTPAVEYLKRRQVWDRLPEDAPGEAIRWHPDGFMACLVRHVVTDRPMAVHRTFLDSAGEKIARKALGPIAAGAVKLSANEDVTVRLGIGEGIETTLSLRALPGFERLPVWSCLMAGNLGSFPILAGVESLWIATDHDQAGMRAADTTAARWGEAGREGFTVMPRAAGADLNDLRGAVNVA